MIVTFLIRLVLAAFKVIKGWLPPAAVKKIKFLTKTNMNEYVTDDNRLEETEDLQLEEIKTLAPTGQRMKKILGCIVSVVCFTGIIVGVKLGGVF